MRYSQNGLLDLAKIKELREGRRLTQEEAGTLARVGGRQAWNDIERGRRKNLTLEALARVAGVLKVRAKDLLTR